MMPVTLYQRHKDELMGMVVLLGKEKLETFERGMVKVDITNAARWFYQDSAQEDWDFEEDFPTITSPWPVTWFEFQKPGFSRSGETIIENPMYYCGERIGAQTCTLQFREDVAGKALREDYPIAFWGSMFEASGQKLPPLPGPSDMEERRLRLQEEIDKGREAKWITHYAMFAEIEKKLTMMGTWTCLIDIDGKAISASQLLFVNAFTWKGQTFSLNPGKMVFPFLFAVSLLHCKNVTTTDMCTDSKIVRAREKKGIPDVRFKTLVVEPLRAQVRKESGPHDPSGIKKALHICRGHFAEYVEKGLFGKYFGTFWVPMHLRGSVDAGRIEKNYEVRR